MRPFPFATAAAGAAFLILASHPARATGEPTNLRVAVPFLNSTTIELSWDDNCDEETEFEFQVMPEGQDWFTFTYALRNSTHIGIQGGGPGDTAFFRMRAVTEEGESAWTEAVEANLPTGFAIESGTFIGGTVGEPLTGPALQVYDTTGPTTASSFSVSALPDGWEFDTSTGVISATPTAPGVFRPLVSATDGTETVSTFVTFRIKRALSGPVELVPLADLLSLSPEDAPLCLDLNAHFEDPDTTSAVRMVTDFGTIDTILYERSCPGTIANFLNYVKRGEYSEVIFHRSAITATSGVEVIQAGLMKPDGLGAYTRVATDPGVVDEPGHSNLTGTLAMAKTNARNSGTSQWYFNTIDNLNLDGRQSNGGYTVFGRGTPSSLPVIAEIQSKPRGSYLFTLDGIDQTYQDVPTEAAPAGAAPTVEELIQIQSVTEIDEFLGYTVNANSNPAVVTAELNGSELTLTPVAGASGTSTITLELTDLDGNVLPIEFSYCVLDLDLAPGISPNGKLAVTFTHEKLPANLSYEVQSSLDGRNWTTFWKTADGVGAAAVVGNSDLGLQWRLTVEDAGISPTATVAALARIVVTKE